MLYSGVDLIEIGRIWAAVARHQDRFLRRVFTPREAEQCCARTESLAGRFAAKEATAKALGTGIWRSGIVWTDIEITRHISSGAPMLHLHGHAEARAQALNWQTWSVSISHDRTHAIAFVIAMAGSPPEQNWPQ